MDAQRDRILGGFRIIHAIRCGKGAQGTIYKAVNVDCGMVAPGTIVALKIMPAHEGDETHQKRMNDRTNALAGISHPNIVRYFGCFTENDSFNDLHVIVQEFLEGETLRERFSRFPYGLDADECIRIACSVASALELTSALGIVHRDIKPGNIFICRDGTIKLIDFEVAQAPAGATASSTNNIRGSFDYMAPEFASTTFRGDVQSDVFSLGVVLHEMLTGHRPYRADSGAGDANFAFLERWSSSSVSPIKINQKIRYLLGGAVTVLSKALSPEREHRYRNFSAFLADLAAVRIKSIRNGGSTYQMLQFIGKGGFGEVFKARVKETGRSVAVKHLLKAEYAKRFEREAKLMSKLDNPCFVRLVDFFYAAGKDGNEAFLVMDFLDGMPGSSLRDAIKEAKGCGMPPAEVLRAFSRYAHGLSLMHLRGIYHRDIKPSNLYYPKGHPENAAIMDLGIARDVNGTVTTGQVPGTLDYMPPEVVVSGSRGESGMDIYALGLCLYEALTGKMAYPRLPTGSAAYATFFRRARERQPPDLEAARRVFGGEVHSLLVKMTEPDIAYRMKDAALLARSIDEIVEAIGGEHLRRQLPCQMPRQTAAPRQAASRPVVRPSNASMAALAPHPAPHRASASPPQRAMPISPQRPFRMPRAFVVSLVSLVATIAIVAVVLAVFGEAIKLKWAEYELSGVIDSWQDGNVAMAEGMESRWVSRWSPVGYGWRRISRNDYNAFTNRLALAKAKIRNDRAAHELELARASERRICIDRITGCRRRDGSLDEDNYMALDGWSLPDWMNGDREVEIRLAGLDQSVFAAIKAKLAVEPVETRLSRIKMASALLRNSWSKRLLSEQDAENAETAIDTVSKWCVVTIRNACSDIISVDGKEIAIGGSRVMLFKDGRSDTRSVARDGYLQMMLPQGLDGKVFEISDSMLEAMPIAVELPYFEGGIVCRIDGKPCSPKAVVQLKPGIHECVYSKRDFKDQRMFFTVHVKVETVVPEPEAWIRTDEYLARRKNISDARSELLSAPVSISIPRLDSGVLCLVDGEERKWGTFSLLPGTHQYRYEREGFEPQGGTFEIEPGNPVRLPSPGVWETVVEAAERKRIESLKAMQDVVREKCNELWANEPVEDRQDRLESAGVRVSKAIYDGILTEVDAAPLLDEINRRKKWAVGKVKNECSVPITVGGHCVDAGATKLIVFESGIPDEWFLEANGYERKLLLRDFDGCILTFDNLDLVPLDVMVDIPKLGYGEVCYFEGSPVSGTIRLKPGSYSCIYRKRGYEDQVVRFEVRPLCPMTLPPPSAWRVK